MTSVEPIAAAGLQSASTVPPTTQKKTHDSEVFLKLLVTQLSNQDPSSPMRHTAAVLMGREAQYTDADGVSQTGTVTAVSFAGPVPLVTIGGQSVPLDALSGLTLSS